MQNSSSRPLKCKDNQFCPAGSVDPRDCLTALFSVDDDHTVSIQ